MRLIDADKIRQKLNPEDWGTPDERWRPESEFGELIDNTPTADPWHYPSRGEYPPKEQEYFVAFKTHREIYYDVRVLNSDLNSLLLACGEQIYAWRYIEPPKDGLK